MHLKKVQNIILRWLVIHEYPMVSLSLEYR